MPEASHHIPLGAFTANEKKVAVSLLDLPQYCLHAVISNVVIRNDSDANLTFTNYPGGPVIAPGERPEFPFDGRVVLIQADAATTSGQVKVAVKVSDEVCR